jgi:phosphatidylserine decarboxylase
MKHAGKARKAALKLILISLLLVAVLLAVGLFAAFFGGMMVAITPMLVALWFIFALFTLFFFRDPTPHVPPGTNLVLSPAHGRIDVIDRTNEPLVIGGECQRISMFLSVMDVHVQNAPVSGKIGFYKYTTGQFLNALKTESAVHNENLLLGFELKEAPGRKIAVRVIAGVLARRIVPFVELGDEVERGDRVGLVQFGSRAEVYFPLDFKLKVQLGEHVTGGESVLAVFE